MAAATAAATVLPWVFLVSFASPAAVGKVAAASTAAQSISTPHLKAHAGNDRHSSTVVVDGFQIKATAEDLERKGRAQARAPADSRSSLEWKEGTGEQSNAAPGESPSVLSFTSTNVYPAITWSPWEHLAEPHREAVLTATSMVGDPDVDLFMWTLPQENGAVFEGRSVLPLFNNPSWGVLLLQYLVVFATLIQV